MILNVPGLRNSGPNHWQTQWEQAYPEYFSRAHQQDWDRPTADHWIPSLIAAVGKIKPRILVGHSVGCATIVHALPQLESEISMVVLVAPSDVDHPDYPDYISGFAPLPLKPLPCSSVVVASDNDHVVSLERAVYFAGCWRSKFEVVPNAGHLEKPWEGSTTMLSDLIKLVN